MYWNYGAFPQTWEDPRVAGGPEVFFARGDADPLDVVEIGGLPLPPGTVVPVKVPLLLANFSSVTVPMLWRMCTYV